VVRAKSEQRANGNRPSALRLALCPYLFALCPLLFAAERGGQCARGYESGLRRVRPTILRARRLAPCALPFGDQRSEVRDQRSEIRGQRSEAQKTDPADTEPRAVASGIKTQPAVMRGRPNPDFSLNPDPARYRSRFCTKRQVGECYSTRRRRECKGGAEGFESGHFRNRSPV